MAAQGISKRHAVELFKVTPLKLSPPSKQGPADPAQPALREQLMYASVA